MYKKQTKIVCTIAHNKCEKDFVKSLFDAGMNVARLNTAHIEIDDANTTDGSSVQYYSWKNGTNGVEIDHYKVLGGDHSWPSLNTNSDKGKSNGDIDSNRIIWEFFSRFDINGLR